MSYSRSSRSDVDDRDYPPPRRPVFRDHDDINIYEQRRERRSSPIRRPATAVYEDDFDVRIRGERDRVPAFLREDNKRSEAGPLVLRQREVETVDRRKPRSPSPNPTVIRERYVERRRSVSPPPRPASRIRPRYVEHTPSPPPQRERDVRVDVDTRVIERRRPRSPTPDRDRDRIHIMMERERERAPSPSPSPSPPPPPAPPAIIKGPTIERQVITHYRDIDHGIERAHPPTPPPAPRTPRPVVRDSRESCDMDIDIRRSRGETNIDVQHTHTRSRSRPAPRPRAQSRPSYDDDQIVIRTSERDRIAVAEATRRRAHSEARHRHENDWDDEAEYITSKIDSRGQMGEAWHGHTRDWTIVDVPPGTERVRMDGVGGGGAEVTWQRYNGVRRSKFIPEREGGALLSTPTSSTPSSDTPAPDRERERLSVQIYDSKDRDRGRSRDRDVEVEEIRDKRISIRESSRAPPKRVSRDMWTEITKDLVVREAIEQAGYNYEETEYFFYVMEYLRYEDVVELVNISDEIRRRDRRRRAREIEWEREYRDSWDRHHHHLHAGHSHSHSHSTTRRSTGWDKADDERVVEREIIYDRPGSRYMR